jgi:hypothetical protein
VNLSSEARHGAFGARAGEWVIRHWSKARRQTLWAECLREMQSFERRVKPDLLAFAVEHQRASPYVTPARTAGNVLEQRFVQ